MKITIVSDFFVENAHFLDFLQKFKSHFNTKILGCNSKLCDFVLETKKVKNGISFAKPNEDLLREAVCESDMIFILSNKKLGKIAKKVAVELEIPFVMFFLPEFSGNKWLLDNSKFVVCTPKHLKTLQMQKHRNIFALNLEKNDCFEKLSNFLNEAKKYYLNYFKKHPWPEPKPKKVYPTNPEQHMMHVKKTKHKEINENFKYLNKNPLFLFLSVLMRILALIFLPFWLIPHARYKIVGKENAKLVKHKGVLITSNHVHVTDSVLCATRVLGPKRKVRIMMLSENMDIPVASTLMMSLGCFPVADTFGGMKKFNKYVQYLLRKKKPVLIFPEAALWPYYRGIRPFHKGTFVFSVKHNAPILPVVLTFRTGKTGKQRVVVNILPPIYPNGRDALKLQKDVEALYKTFTERFYKKYR